MFFGNGIPVAWILVLFHNLRQPHIFFFRPAIRSAFGASVRRRNDMLGLGSRLWHHTGWGTEFRWRLKTTTMHHTAHPMRTMGRGRSCGTILRVVAHHGWWVILILTMTTVSRMALRIAGCRTPRRCMRRIGSLVARASLVRHATRMSFVAHHAVRARKASVVVTTLKRLVATLQGLRRVYTWSVWAFRHASAIVHRWMPMINAGTGSQHGVIL